MKVLARFYVGQHIRFPGWRERSVLLDKFTLGGVQGEPFGSATPSASMELVIANPEAAKEFALALEHGEEFNVTFERIEKPKESVEPVVAEEHSQHHKHS